MLGVEKIRITGGEPLLRKGVETLIEGLACLRTPEGKDVEIALTTMVRCWRGRPARCAMPVCGA